MAVRDCSKCGETKPLSSFNKDKTKPLGLKTYCKSCHRESARLYALDKREIYSARASSWYFRNKSKKQEYDAAYRKNYSDRQILAINAKTNARRRRLRGATPPWANLFFIKEIYEIALLRKRSLGIDFVVDHIIPISSDLVCGLHVEHNLRIVARDENLSKSNRWWPDMP